MCQQFINIIDHLNWIQPAFIALTDFLVDFDGADDSFDIDRQVIMCE
jgi:hypothetical protein